MARTSLPSGQLGSGWVRRSCQMRSRSEIFQSLVHGLDSEVVQWTAKPASSEAVLTRLRKLCSGELNDLKHRRFLTDVNVSFTQRPAPPLLMLLPPMTRARPSFLSLDSCCLRKEPTWTLWSICGLFCEVCGS